MPPKKPETKGTMQKRHHEEVKDFQKKAQLYVKKAADKKEAQQEMKEEEAMLLKKHQKQLKKLLEAQESDDDDENDENDKVKKPTEEELAKLEEERKQKEREKLQKKGEEKRKREFEKRKQEQDELDTMGASNRQLELESINAIIVPLGLRIRDIPADGNCLYRSLADQLQQFGYKSDDYVAIRKLIANYMRTHVDEFIGFMETSSGDLMNIEQYNKYCDNVEHTNEWGGQIEIRALVGALQVSVRIFQGMGAPIIDMGESFAKKHLILLSYHKHYYSLGEHYNSVVPIK